MNQLQIDSLRDLAIEHLPRAQADREQIKRYGGSHADLYRKLAVTAVVVRAKAGTLAIEFAAANVLDTVTLLCLEREEPLLSSTRIELMYRLTKDAKELCALTGKTIAWLDLLATPPEPAPPEEVEEATAQSPPSFPLAGRLLSTREAAQVLGYAPQTLRKWASDESGPIRPIKKAGAHNRWSGDEILALMASKFKR